MGDRTQTSSSSVQLPQWLEDAAKGTIDRGVTQSQVPLTQFDKSAVADFTPDQLAAFQGVRNAQGIWGGNMSDADAAADAAGGISQQGAIGQYLSYLDQRNPVDSAQPWLNEIGNTSIAGSASPLVQAASQSSASNVNEYLNPYNEAVTSRLATLAGRNLQENLLPQVNDTFTRAGQFGSGRNADFTARALRDTQESLLGKQAEVLQSGYQGALSAAATDAARRAGLAGTVGNLTAADVQRLATGANLGQTAIMNDVSKLATSANLASNAAAGDRAGALQLAQLQAQLGGQKQQQALTDADTLNKVGATQQALNQQKLSEEKGNFTEARDYEKNQLDWLNSLIRGTPAPSTTTTTSPAPNWLSQLGGLGLAAYGLYSRRDGGRIPAANGLYVDPDLEEDDWDNEDDAGDFNRGPLTRGSVMGGSDDDDAMADAVPLPYHGRQGQAAAPSKPLDTGNPLGRAQATLLDQINGISERLKTASEERRKAAAALAAPDKNEDSLDARFASPLVRLGLGMAASKSPTLLGGIGEGGLAAAQAAQQRLSKGEDRNLTRKKLALEAAKLEEGAVGDELKNVGTIARLTGAAGKGTAATSPLGKLKSDLTNGIITPEEYREKYAQMTRIPPGPVDPSTKPSDPVAKLEADYKAGRIDEETYKARKQRLTQPLPEPMERAESAGIGKANADRYNSYQATGTKARLALDNLDATTALLDQVRAQGAAGPLLKTVQSTLQTFGIDPTTINLENAGPAEAADALSSALIMSQLGSLGAGISNADRDFIKSQVVGLGNTKEGNTLIAEVLRRQHQRGMEVAKLAREYRKGGGDLANLDDYIDEKLATKPLFDDSFKQKIVEVAKSRAPKKSHADRLREIEAEIERRKRGG